MDSSLIVHLILMLMLLQLRFSSAYAYQDIAKKSVLPASKRSEVKKAKSLGYVKEIDNSNTNESDDDGSVAEAEDVSFMVRGRKMLSPMGLLSEASKLKHLNAGDSEIPGAAHSNCQNSDPRRKRILDVNYNINRRDHPRHSPVDVKLAGLLSFNADYHVPRPRPPKNN